MASLDRRVYERWTSEAERWYLQYRPAALAWARRMDRLRPGNDWLTVSLRALEKAAMRYRPDQRASFGTWWHRNIRNEMAGMIRTDNRRRDRLPRVPLHDETGAIRDEAGRAAPHPDFDLTDYMIDSTHNGD